MKKIFSLFLQGIAWGCTMTVFISIVGASTVGASFLAISPETYIRYSLCAMMVGVGFSVPSLVYDNEKLAFPLRIFIHMGIGLVIYFICAHFAGWLPVNQGFAPLLGSIFLALLISFVIWCGFYLYHRKEAIKINEKIRDRQNI